MRRYVEIELKHILILCVIIKEKWVCQLKKQDQQYYVFEIDGKCLNGVSIFLMLGIVILTFLLNPDFSFYGKEFDLAFLFMIPYLVLHEIIHGISYVLCGAKYKNITFGAHLEKGILCCLCKEKVSKPSILISLICPFIFLGVCTYIAGLYLHNNTLIILSMINISGCAGDLVMFFDFLSLKNMMYSEYDNPLAFGLYTTEDLSHKHFFGLRYLETTKDLSKTITKKVVISNISLIIILILFFLGILNFL